MNKLDRFFKKKVEALTVEPRPEAWSKLESNLSKKNNGLIWFRAAAAFLLVGLFVTTIVWVQKRDASQSLAEQAKKENSSIASEGNKLKKEEIEQVKPIEESKGIKPKKKSPLKKLEAIETQETIESITKMKPESAPLETIPRETVAAATIVEKPIVIEYTLETIPSRKKEIPAVAAAVEKKNSLQKAIDFAREAKNSDSPLGELRQAKDDLFALNFKKDKQKKQ